MLSLLSSRFRMLCLSLASLWICCTWADAAHVRILADDASVQFGSDDVISLTKAGQAILLSSAASSTTFAVDGNAVIGDSATTSLYTPPENGLLVKGNVAIGTTTQTIVNKLGVAGAATIGSNYPTTAAPSNGLLVEGQVGIGVTSFNSKLAVHGNVVIGDAATVIGVSPPANGLHVQGDIQAGGTVDGVDISALSSTVASLGQTAKTHFEVFQAVSHETVLANVCCTPWPSGTEVTWLQRTFTATANTLYSISYTFTIRSTVVHDYIYTRLYAGSSYLARCAISNTPDTGLSQISYQTCTLSYVGTLSAGSTTLKVWAQRSNLNPGDTVIAADHDHGVASISIVEFTGTTSSLTVT